MYIYFFLFYFYKISLLVNDIIWMFLFVLLNSLHKLIITLSDPPPPSPRFSNIKKFFSLISKTFKYFIEMKIKI